MTTGSVGEVSGKGLLERHGNETKRTPGCEGASWGSAARQRVRSTLLRSRRRNEAGCAVRCPATARRASPKASHCVHVCVSGGAPHCHPHASRAPH
eukprot:CAMPEP_0119357448 /NCGR_PEP_ID=MMETSP1334-20130426/5837_1 /TAXON_ID=127549 /ORGANISM="Calcidiscus leptoporus, Strain RCC1130" /LENGTH=95 /DNA_ID=CAMNT_0007371695 /DNA_START=251 /DNA_END=535 /DNA_ORIENTATION=+